MLNLRGHHLICLNFFQGEGYDQAFIENLREVIGKAGSGQEITVVKGADDICRACPSLVHNRCMHSDSAETEIETLDQTALEYLDIPVGKKVLWPAIKAKVGAATDEWFATFCAGCDWEKVCRKQKRARST